MNKKFRSNERKVKKGREGGRGKEVRRGERRKNPLSLCVFMWEEKTI